MHGISINEMSFLLRPNVNEFNLMPILCTLCIHLQLKNGQCLTQDATHLRIQHSHMARHNFVVEYFLFFFFLLLSLNSVVTIIFKKNKISNKTYRRLYSIPATISFSSAFDSLSLPLFILFIFDFSRCFFLLFQNFDSINFLRTFFFFFRRFV